MDAEKKHNKNCGKHFSPHDFTASGYFKRGSTPSSNPHLSSISLGIFLNIHTYDMVERIGNREGYEISLSQYFFNQPICFYQI